MLVRAKISFSGAVSMTAGDVREIKDKYVLNDLLRAGYIEPEAQEAKIVEKPVEKVKVVSDKPVEKSKPKRTYKKKVTKGMK